MLSRSLRNLARDFAALTSGDRIFAAAEDPAGLVISEHLRSQIASLTAEISGISATIDKYSAVGAGMVEMNDQLVVLRSLAVAAANEAGNSPEAQAAYAKAAENIVTRYNTSIDTAEYNGQKTLDGSAGSVAALTKLSGIDLSSAEAANASMALIDTATDQLQQAQVDLGSKQRYDLESRQSQLEVTRENLIASESNLRDVDFASYYSSYVADLIRARVGVAMSAHQALNAAIVLQLFNS
jgi:flagellin